MKTERQEWESPDSETVKPVLKQLKLEDPSEMKTKLQFEPSMESGKGIIAAFLCFKKYTSVEDFSLTPRNCKWSPW